ncbi:O-antigen ligase family protein [Pseudaminobacter soli (ex Li et al. 2025)]|uniref:Exopolysaccharide biosynthesis protein n=1 Tax=Pseudaminobacter soli (ex Li et al. 2025) TaxID=1295366 RepID=A0A2P7SGL7_9HYPH|nr:O-antigen ligase [Mesorhizobium soli]PSJ61617.1 exopolysaccharide biosynthesis protein [Mesorhizobium soli]
MKIAKARFVSPDSNFAYGFVAVALSIFIFAYSTRFGQAPILLYYALWLPLVLVDYRQSLGNYLKFHWVVAFGLLTCLSVFWSAAPGVTARAGLQYMSHIVCALIAARTVGVRTLTLGVLTGVCLVVLYSLAFGGYHYDPLDGNYSFVGAFSSKNLLGFFSSLGIYFGFAALFILRERGLWALLALATFGLAGYALIASQSATSIIATVATLAMLMGLRALLLFAPRTRKTFFLVVPIAGLFVVFIGLNAGGVDLLLGAFGKDSTLTGRTYLWGEGLAAWAQAPTFGVGYQAYWVQGFSEAERLWEEFYIGSRSGFHFHNTYIEVLVELGVTGLLLLALVLLRVLVGHLVRLLDDADNVASHVMVGLAAMLAVRSFFEVDVIHPYAVGSFMLYYAAGVAASSPATSRLVAQEPAAAPPGLRHA